MVDTRVEDNPVVGVPAQRELPADVDLAASAEVRPPAAGAWSAFRYGAAALPSAEHLRKAAVEQAVEVLLRQEQAGSCSAAALRIGVASLSNALQNFAAVPCRMRDGLICLQYAQARIHELSAAGRTEGWAPLEAIMREAWDNLLRFGISRGRTSQDSNTGGEYLASAERALMRAARLVARPRLAVVQD